MSLKRDLSAAGLAPSRAGYFKLLENQVNILPWNVIRLPQQYAWQNIRSVKNNKVFNETPIR